MTPLLVAIGAAVGATARFWLAHRLDGHTPWGTLLVNVVGSFALGWLVGAELSAHTLALLGTGVCGGLTTYSAFAVQSRDQARMRGLPAGGAYAAATVLLSLGACAVGFVAGQA